MAVEVCGRSVEPSLLKKIFDILINSHCNSNNTKKKSMRVKQHINKETKHVKQHNNENKNRTKRIKHQGKQHAIMPPLKHIRCQIYCVVSDGRTRTAKVLLLEI